MLEYLIKQIKTATGLPVRPFATKEVETCVVYEYSTSSDNGAMVTDNLKLRIIGKSVGEVLEIDKKIRKALLIQGDGTGKIRQIELNGGGMLEELNTQTIHKFDYYYITYKSEV